MVITYSFKFIFNLISLIPLIAPLPFLGLEVFVGFIQALVFTMLTTIFIVVATEGHHE